MELDKSQGMFVFVQDQDLDQEQLPIPKQQNNNQKQESKTNIKSSSMLQPSEVEPRQDHQEGQAGENEIQPTLIKVQPVAPPFQEEEPLQGSSNLLYASQTSEQNEVQVVQETIKYQEKEESKSQILFEYPQADDLQQSPQSSLRKLYKVSQIIEEEKQAAYEEPPERLLNEDISESKLYEKEYDSDLEEQYEEVQNKKQLKSSNIEDLILFPIIKTKMIRCLVIVTNNKFFAFENIFDLYLVQEKRHLLRAVKKKFRMNSVFEIFGKQKTSPSSIAVVRSNFTRTEYKLLKYEKRQQMESHSQGHQMESHSQGHQMESHSQGPPPSQVFSSDIIKMEAMQVDWPQQSKSKEEVCYISYESNFFGLSQQKVTMLKARKNIVKTDRFSDLKASYQNCEYERISSFTTRMAEKGTDGQLILDFKEKNITNSSRNMIIENQFSEAGVMFAKFSDDIFILNVMNPFNLLEAFFLGLCNLDRKPFVS